VKKFTILFSISVFLLACQRPQDEGTSKLTLDFSKNSNSEKVSSLSNAFPTNRKLCFGVNVLGSGIPESNPSCSPTLGLVGGFIEDGQILNLQVPRGTGRTIDLYLYSQQLGQPCPQTTNLNSLNLQLIYKIGSATNVDTSKDETAVKIDAQYPGDASHLASNLSLPASCTSSFAQSPGIKMNLAIGQAVNGNNYKMKIRARETR